MKAITVKVKPEELGTLLSKVRTSQELGFTNIDLAISLKVDVSGIVREIQAAGSKVQSLRLAASPNDWKDTATPSFIRLASPNDRVRSSSVALVTSVCQGLSRSGVATVVLDGGVVDAPGAIWPAIEASLEEGGDDTAKLVKQALELRAALIDKALPALCRSIFELTKACEGLRFGILTPLSPLGVCLPTEMEHLLSDAPPKAVGYWHSTSAARCLENLGVANEEQWLDRFGPRMFGVYLSDSVGAQGEQAPGLGEVNFKRIKPYLATNMARVLTIDDDASSSKLRFGADHLCEVGIF